VAVVVAVVAYHDVEDDHRMAEAAAYGMAVLHTRVADNMAVFHELAVYSSMAVLHTRVADNMADCYNTAACSNNLA
jgi:hypothetical protein